jgi:hypothetical protein
MVQAHGLVQLSMGAAQIGGVVDINTPFTLCLTPDAENKPREPTIKLVKEVFEMMEVKKEGLDLRLQKHKQQFHRLLFKCGRRNQGLCPEHHHMPHGISLLVAQMPGMLNQ